MNAPALSKIERLRQRDGDDCWLCGNSMDFEAKPNTKKAPTKEHLQSVSAGGTDALENLVLCHPGCNRQLGDRPRADKEKMRAKRIAKAAASAAPKAPGLKAPQQGKPLHVTAGIADRTDEVDWRTVAWGAIAVAMFFAGAVFGLVLGR
jgi:hypothetical protein